MEYLIKLNRGELELIAAALKEIPWKLADPVLHHIQAQFDEQNKPQQTPNVVPIKEDEYA